MHKNTGISVIRIAKLLLTAPENNNSGADRSVLVPLTVTIMVGSKNICSNSNGDSTRKKEKKENMRHFQ